MLADYKLTTPVPARDLGVGRYFPLPRIGILMPGARGQRPELRVLIGADRSHPGLLSEVRDAKSTVCLDVGAGHGSDSIRARCREIRPWRGRRALGLLIAVIGIWLIACGGCDLSARDSNAQGSGVIFGRVLSLPGVHTQPMPPPTPIAGRRITVSPAAGGAVIASAISGSGGGFRFSLPPGDYSVAGVGSPHLVHLDPGRQLQVDLHLPNP